jgi:hypothetical protein
MDIVRSILGRGTDDDISLDSDLLFIVFFYGFRKIYVFLSLRKYWTSDIDERKDDNIAFFFLFMMYLLI